MKKLIVAFLLLLTPALAQAACPSGSPGGINCQSLETIPFNATGATQSNTMADQFGKYLPISAVNFGQITFNGSYDATEAANNRTAIQAAIDYAIANGNNVVRLPCGNSSSSKIWLNGNIFAAMSTDHSVVTGAADNGSGAIRLTVASTSTWTTGDGVTVWSVGGTTEANSTLTSATDPQWTRWTITVIDSTHIDLQGSTFTNAYTSGGTVYNPVGIAFSLYLKGCGGSQFTGINQGTNLYFVDGLLGPAIIYGPGRGLGGDHFSVHGQFSGVVCNNPQMSMGVAYSSKGSVFSFDSVTVYNFYTLFGAGWGGDGSLADHAEFNNVDFEFGKYGLAILESQAFIYNITNSTISGSTYNFYNNYNVNINVRGGNYATQGTHANVFAIGSTSSINSSGVLTTTLSSPDAAMGDGCYNAYVIKTANFGPVPFTATYNSATHVATLTLQSAWLTNNFGANDITSATDLAAELQAATQLFAVQRWWNFYGGGFDVQGIHVEGDVPQVLIDTSNGSEQATIIRNVRNNGDPADSLYYTCLNNGTTCEARYLVSQTFPTIRIGNNSFSMSDYYPAQSGVLDPIIIDVTQQDAQGTPISCNFERLYKAYLVVRWFPYVENDDHEQNGANRYKGACNWDHSYWQFRNSGNVYALAYFNGSDNAVPFKGFRPQPWAIPALTPNQYSQVSGSLPAFGTYPLIHGGTIYQVNKEGTTSARSFVTSLHQFFSWGKDLTFPWSYKGASNIVYIGVAITGAANNGSGLCRLTVSDTSALATDQKMIVNGIQGAWDCNGQNKITVIDGTHVDVQSTTFSGSYTSGGFLSDTSMMFVGLSITLNFAAADHLLLITGVYPGQGFVTVTNPTPITAGIDETTINPGVKTTVYTGTTIKQQPYTWNSVALAP